MSTEQKEGMLLPTRKQHSHKKESHVLERRKLPIQLPLRVPLRALLIQPMLTQVALQTPRQTLLIRVCLRALQPRRAKLVETKMLKFANQKPCMNKSGVSSPLISFCFIQLSILTTVQEPPSSTLLTTINVPCHLYHVRIETSCNR